jgi:NADH-dependent peroxiredoxin subunit F
MDKVYDLIIVGAGPAGITAAIYAERKKIDFLVVTKDIGGQAAWSGDVENYTGQPVISGPELVVKFKNHISGLGAKVLMPQALKELKVQDKTITVTTDKNKYFCRTAVIATGKRPRSLNVPGEIEYRNKGVTYCATCDGPVFSGKNVVVIGGGNSALDATLQLAAICPLVYVVNPNPDFTGDPIMSEKVKALPNIKAIFGATVTNIYGKDFVSGIEIKNKKNSQKLEVEGVFVEIGLFPNSDFSSTLALNDKNEIIIDCHNRTNLEGVYAAGDATTVPEKQIIVACGEGAKAALGAFSYLNRNRFK